MNIKKTFYHLKWIYLLGVFALLFLGLVLFDAMDPSYKGSKTVLKKDFLKSVWASNISFTPNDKYIIHKDNSGKFTVFNAETGNTENILSDIYHKAMDKTCRYIIFSNKKNGKIAGFLDLIDFKKYPLTDKKPVIITDKNGVVQEIIPSKIPKKNYFNNFLNYVSIEPGTVTTNVSIRDSIKDSIIFQTQMPSLNEPRYKFEFTRQNELRVFTGSYDEAAISTNSHIKFDLETGTVIKKIASRYDREKKQLIPRQETEYQTDIINNDPGNLIVRNTYREHWNSWTTKLSTSDKQKLLYSFQDKTSIYIVPASQLKKYQKSFTNKAGLTRSLLILWIVLLVLFIICKFFSRNYPDSLTALEKFDLKMKLSLDEIKPIKEENILEQIVLDNQYSDKEKLAAMKINFKNQEVFLKVFKNTKGENLRVKAVKMVSDQKILQTMFKNTLNETLLEKIAKKIEDHAFLEAQFPTANTDINDQIIEKSSNQEFLKNIALTHEESSKRKEATEKLNKEDILFDIAATDKKQIVRIAAVRKIKDEQLLSDLTKTKGFNEVKQAALKQITDQKLLLEIALDNPFDFISCSAVKKINSSKVLIQIAQSKAEDSVRVKAIKRIANKKVLETIVDQTDRPKVKDAAAQKLNKMAGPDLKNTTDTKDSELEYISTPTNLFGPQTNKNLAIAYLENTGQRAKAEGIYSIWSWVDSRNSNTCYQFIANIQDSNSFEFDSPEYVTQKTRLYEQGTMSASGRELGDGTNWLQKDADKAAALQGGDLEEQLFEAIEAEDETKVRTLLSQGANANAHGGRFDEPALKIAAVTGSIPIADLLLENGADVNYKDAEGFALITLVAHSPTEKTPAMLHHLKNKGADIYATTARGIPAIQIIQSHMKGFEF